MVNGAIDSALQRFTTSDGDPVALLRGLIDAIRPPRAADSATAIGNWRALNAALAASDAYRRGVSAKIIELLATRRLATFFTEEGILPPTGFFSELWRKIVHKVLPEVRDERVFKDCLVLILHRSNDHVWLNAIPMEDKLAFWRNLDWQHAPDRAQVDRLYEQLLEALLVVSHGMVGLAFHPELRRVCPEVEERPSPFLSLHQELARFVDQCRANRERTNRDGADAAAPDSPAPDQGARVARYLTLCRVQLSQAYAGTLIRGVRLSLTYLLTRLEQHLDRLTLLHGLLSARDPSDSRAPLLDDVDGFMRSTVVGQTRRNSVRKHVSDLVGMLALRVTENASRTGEHYITSDWPGLRALWLSAMGAGLVIAFMALIKLNASHLALTTLGYGVVNSLTYGLGFVFIALVHFTIATKQPAMTAARIADAIHTSGGELREDQGLVSLIVDTLRSQLAAILGNVALALLTATAIAWFYASYLGRPVADESEARYLLAQINPLGATLFYAAIAGVWLFVAGLICGYFDNLATYTRIGERIGSLRWLEWLLGRDRARRFGGFVDQNLGTVVGNFLFGCMLGMTGPIGAILGLPIDVRHVTFSAANLALAMASVDVPAGVVLQSALGVALIGFVNLTVSFTLALYVALRSRGASFAAVPSLVAHTAQRLVKNPLRLLVPAHGAVAQH